MAAPPAATRAVSVEDATAFLRIAAPDVNPFINHTWGKLPFGQYVKIAIAAATLVPLRVIATLIIVLAAVLCACLGTACLQKGDFDRPLSLWRRAILAPIRPLLRLELAVLGVWVTVHGHPAPKAQAPIVVSNHVCLLDPLFLVATLGACPVSAAENLRFPVISQILIALQCVFVVRDKQGVLSGRPQGAPQATPAASHHPEGAVAKIATRARDDSFGPVLVFPEGSCTNGTAIIQFKSGAFAPGLAVQPVAVRYPFVHFDPSWTPTVDINGLLALLFCQVYTCMHVTYLPVIAPTPEYRANPELFASNVRAAIAAALPGVRMTQHSFDDVVLTKIALAARFPIEKAVVELNRLRSTLSIDTRTAAEYLKLFARIDTKHTGSISIDQFVAVFSGRPAPASVNAPTLPVPVGGAQSAAGSSNTSSLDTALQVVPSEFIVVHDPPSQPTLSRVSSVTSSSDPQAGQGVHGVKFECRVSSICTMAQVTALRRLFALIDSDGDGRLDYREFLVGLCVVNERGPHGRRDALRLAFEILDTDRMGSLDRNQFGRMIALLKPGLPCTSVDAVFIDAGASGDGSMLRLSAAQFIAWGDAHGNESDLFRKTFLGFSSELSMLATETQQTAAMASTVG